MTDAAGEALPRRLFFYNAGFLNRDLRRAMALAGFSLHLGRPAPGDGVVVWGRSPYAARGEAVAARLGLPLVRVEDAFLRGVKPGRMGGSALGLMIDGPGVHFDSSVPSVLELILASNPLDDSNLLSRAKEGIARLRHHHLSKYNMHAVPGRLPPPGYVLVVDQTRGDASIRHGGASEATFRELLVLAQEEHPAARIVIKTHPETAAGLRPGHFSPADAGGRISLCTEAVSPQALLDGAVAVYTVSSQLGFEAILAGHRPVVLGQPFYAGWGLTDDRNPVPRRRRTLTRAQLFAGAMILAPVWVDPCRDRLMSFEEALDQLEAEVRAYREDRAGHVAVGMRTWKRGRLQEMFGREKPVLFRRDLARGAALAERTGRSLLAWGTTGMESPGGVEVTGPAAAPPVIRVEDGFLRSRGLGAELVPPLSLVQDDLGLYYDPSRESRLERLILTPPPPGGLARAEALRQRLIASGLSKYNLASPAPASPVTGSTRGPEAQAAVSPIPGSPDTASPGEAGFIGIEAEAAPHAPATAPESPRRVLVVGQVEDDASIRLGAGPVRTNLGLLEAARVAQPGAVLIYKPHPDVEAGLRPGAIPADALGGLADFSADRANPVALLDEVDEIWTMTSLLGFEALLRSKPVTTLGAPFFAGWGLTRDLGPVPERRAYAPDGHPLPRPSLAQLVHAALIAYPRYYDPVSRRPCPPEVVLDRLAQGEVPHPGPLLRGLSKLQGLLASQAWVWRR